MDIQWLGTASIKISLGNTSLYFDPFISMNPMLQYTSIDDYADATDIFVTHGHFDHIYTIPQIWKMTKCVIYCGIQVANVLLRQGILPDYIRIIDHGQVISIPPFIIKIYRSEHIRFDFPLIVKTLFHKRVLHYFDNFKNIASMIKKMPAGIVFAYEIVYREKSILHFGSLNYSSAIAYPYNPSVLTIPLQGRSDIHDYAIEFIKKFMPQKIFLHHFDDTFPPLSSNVDTTGFVENVIKIFPEMTVIIPEYGISYKV
ncbi:MAG: MBL fold metallo-hydrolase [Spirochaetes bacterium]|nr:MBL fold metallo-hydrolase [Spirochaetota bacterium]